MGRPRLLVLRARWVALLWAAFISTPSCRPPGQQEREAEIQRLMQAKAVHMPPGVDSCVGVTLRLNDETSGAAEERALMAGRLSEGEIATALEVAGKPACLKQYFDGIEEAKLAPEPLLIRFGFGIDPAGRVCAVVERERSEPFDPSLAGFVEESATCLKEVLFRARFPAGRVEDKERIVLFAELKG